MHALVPAPAADLRARSIAPRVSPTLFEHAVARCPRPVVVVTGAAGGCPVGVEVRACTPVDAAGPAFGVWVALSTTWRSIADGGRFALNLLAEGDGDRCGEVVGDRWPSDVAWVPGRTGAPLLCDAVVSIECRLVDLVALGRDEVAVGEVVDVRLGADAAPAITYLGRVGGYRDRR